jgi:hypothetical protein
MNREITDLDFVTYEKFRDKVKIFFGELGYKPAERFIKIQEAWGSRQIYSKSAFHVDVFFDKLDMSHVIDFRGRLDKDFPTIPLAELLLEKLQIVKINEKDIKDVIILLREHTVADNDHETINLSHLSKLFAKDWGLYHTAVTNLIKVRGFLKNYSTLKEQDISDVSAKIDSIIDYVRSAPKSLNWKIRSLIGERKKWYKDVEEIHTAP